MNWEHIIFLHFIFVFDPVQLFLEVSVLQLVCTLPTPIGDL